MAQSRSSPNVFYCYLLIYLKVFTTEQEQCTVRGLSLRTDSLCVPRDLALELRRPLGGLKSEIQSCQ